MRHATGAELAAALRAGDRRALARAISLVEEGAPGARELIQAVYPHTGRAHVIGITGSPGAGKSTLVSALARAYRREGKTVGVVAVDPSSPFTGGALLGDRIRLDGDAPDPGLFFRSLASRGQAGGLSRAASDVVDLMDAAGREVILIETVGAGQSEVDVMDVAHTTVVVTMPGVGDEIQAAKAGILEIGDIFVVNKADRDGADTAVAALEMMLDLGAGVVSVDAGHHGAGALAAPAAAPQPQMEGAAWRPPVLKTVARDGVGIPELIAALARHRAFLDASPAGLERRRRRAADRLLAVAARMLLERLARRDGRLDSLAADVAARRLDVYSAAEALLSPHPMSSQRVVGTPGTDKPGST